MIRRIKGMVVNVAPVAGVVFVGMAGSAHAALTLPASLSVTDAEAVAGLVVVAVAAIWAMRKAIGFLGSK